MDHCARRAATQQLKPGKNFCGFTKKVIFADD